MTAAKNKVCFLGFKKLFSLAQAVIEEMPSSDTEYLLMDCNMDTQDECVREALDHGCEVFIASSGNAAWFSSHYNYPLVEVVISPIDYAMAVHSAKAAGCRRIAVLRQRSAAVLDIPALASMLEVSVTELKYETYEELLQAVKSSDCDAVVGAAAAIEAAELTGKAGFDVYFSSDGIRDACLRAADLAKELRRERRNREITKAMMNNAQLGIIVSDPEGRVLLFNRMASQYTEILSGQISGKKLSSFFPNLSPEAFLKSGKRRNDSYRLVQGAMMRCVQEQIRLNDETFAVLTTLYPEAHNRRKREEEKGGLNAHIWHWDELTAESEAMRRLVRDARSVTVRNQPLAIFAEPGCAQEEIAYCIHGGSERADFPCVTLDFATIDDRDAARSFFGYEGSDRSIDGFFQYANHGSIVLKNISLAGPAALACLREILSGQAIFRPGMESAVTPDLCIYTATTKKELEALAPELSSQLTIGTLNLPPLRERQEDIPILFLNYVTRLSELSGIGNLTDEMLALLQRYSWPGNILELRAVCTRYVLARSEARRPSSRAKYLMLLHAIGEDTFYKDFLKSYPALQAGPSDDRRAFLDAALEVKEWLCLSNDALADRLGLSRTTLWRIMRETATIEQK